MEEWEEFFRDYGDYTITLNLWESRRGITVEKLYQLFASRFKAELAETLDNKD